MEKESQQNKKNIIVNKQTANKQQERVEGNLAKESFLSSRNFKLYFRTGF